MLKVKALELVLSQKLKQQFCEGEKLPALKPNGISVQTLNNVIK